MISKPTSSDHRESRLSPEISVQFFFKLAPKIYIRKKQNGTFYVVAMVTLLAPVSFCEKTNSPICNPLSGTEGLDPNTSGSHIVLTLPIRLLGVDNPCLR